VFCCDGGTVVLRCFEHALLLQLGLTRLGSHVGDVERDQLPRTVLQVQGNKGAIGRSRSRRIDN
jgi:hypothetical protein